ncbi:hypothetical protein [Noviherbaspirillum soli]|uniref:hypothetical protein n=1 Tax=Noviherbaspirillum soli TaxID=1064518 RepID=UPI00188D9DE7|nr:hypothetical protein [Noviherbaspirillum soli]
MGKIGKSGLPSRKSSSANPQANQQETQLLIELDNSWVSSEEDGSSLHYGQDKENIPVTARRIKKTSQPALRTTATSGTKPSNGKAPAPTAKSVDIATGQDSSLVDSSLDQASNVVSTSDATKQKASGLARTTTVVAAKKRASVPNATQSPVKPAKDQDHQDLLPLGPGQKKQKAKVIQETKQQRLQRLMPEEVAYMNGYKVDLIELMTGEDTDQNAEVLYQQVAAICTDKKLKKSQKLECLRGEAGKVCTTLTQDVNAYFDALVIQHYVDNHAQHSKKENEPKKGMRRSNEGERKGLLSGNDPENDDDNIAGHDNDSIIAPDKKKYNQDYVLEEFKSTLNWWERRKLEKIQPEEKFANDPHRKAELQKIELLRKMQKRLTADERSIIRRDAKIYHDLLVNSGLPVLHIAVKNESCKLVRAYLLAVMSFAPSSITKNVIQAKQHQGLQAFYWAMTHSTTDMIKIFMETVLNSDFLFFEEKKEILHARRPDPEKNGAFGIGGFYMAMASGDIARADAFMSQLLAWDPNCRIQQFSDIKVELLEGFKSNWLKDKAKGAAVENGHKELVEKYNQYVESSHLRRIEKDLLFAYNKIHDPQERYLRFENEAEAEAAEKLMQEVFKTLNMKMPREGGDLPQDVEMAPGVPMQGHTRTHKIIAHERKRSILEMNKKPIPEYLKKKSIKDYASRPFRNVDEAGNYATLSTFPKPNQNEKRRTDGDYLLGPPPAISKQARRNSWQERKENNTLPPRSGSYASGLVSLAALPALPASMSALPRLDELSPIKLTPSPKRRSSQHTGLPNGTPTRLFTEKAGRLSPTSDSSSINRKNLQKRRSMKEANRVTDGSDLSIPS